ncbi:MAG TPA: hypothetical protein VJ949_03355, partial [Cryomorphaceae bacterium]|nr:hypothetical protein [Cryomorphaceae bacterium]
MTLFSVRSILVVLALAIATVAGAQEKESLQKERDKISEEISYTNKLLQETRQNRSKMEGELGLLN